MIPARYSVLSGNDLRFLCGHETQAPHERLLKRRKIHEKQT
jgi:hypothetical protein